MSGPGVARPAGLDGEASEVDLRRRDLRFLARRAAHAFRRHVEHLSKYRQRVPGRPHALGRIGRPEKGEQAADLAQGLRRFPAHAERYAPGGAEEVREHRHLVVLRLLEEQGGPLAAQGPVADLRDFEVRVDRRRDAPELTPRFEQIDELAKVPVLHRSRFIRRFRIPPSPGCDRKGVPAGEAPCRWSTRCTASPCLGSRG